ncbi:unnamed protein product [Closterium sp. NIES-64]|nr:unnamed protein product [Closterium sp. NIES-64]
MCIMYQLVEPLTGKTWSLSDFDGHPALLVMFICNHCPFVVHIKSQLVALGNEYISKHGLAVVAISSNSVLTHPQDGPDKMAEEAKQFNFPFPYLYDEEVAKTYHAACTPDFFLFKKDGRRPFELAYHGQLDDSRPNNGRPVTGKDLRAALDCVLSARPVPRPPSELAYHCQLDDSRPSNGRQVTGKDLRAALDCVLSARPVPSGQKPR